MSAAPASGELGPGEHEVIAFAAGPVGPPGAVTAVRPDGTDPTAMNLFGAPSLSGGEVVATSRFEGPGGKPGIFIPPRDRIVVSRSDGTNGRLLSGGAASISPTGTEILYNSLSGQRPGTLPSGRPPGDILRAPLELTPVAMLTRTSDADEGEPDWLGDGSRIVFESNLDGPDYDVFAASADGNARVNLTPASPDDDFAPAASADGATIAFARRATDGRSDLWAMGADGSAPTQITNTPARNEIDPVFSPDGTRIAFGASEQDTGRSDVYVIGTDGSGEVPLSAGTERGGQKPDWGTLTVLPARPTCNGASSNVVGTDAGDRLNDTIYPFIRVASGLGGDDRIKGSAHADTLCGNAGGDVLRGRSDDDTLVGGAGPDVLKGGKGRDLCLNVGKRDTTSRCKVR